MSRQIQISIRRLLKADERLEKYLREIVKQVKPNTSAITVKCLNNLIAKPLVWDHFFKVLILLNNFIVNDQIPLKQAANILNFMKIKNKDYDDCEIVLINELLIPYRFYLQKRCTIVFNFEKQECEVKCFALLNLLNTGSCFSKMIFRLARYYPTKLKYAQDFNIAWAADLSEMYYQMTKHITFPVKPHLKQQLQLIHEPLYNVFYNCYFHKHLVRFIPRWIRTDDVKPKQIKRDDDKENPQMKSVKKEFLPVTSTPSHKKPNETFDSTNITRDNSEKNEFSRLHFVEENDISLKMTYLNRLNEGSNQVSQFTSEQEKKVNEQDLLQFIELTKQFQHLEMAIRKVECLQQIKL